MNYELIHTRADFKIVLNCHKSAYCRGIAANKKRASLGITKCTRGSHGNAAFLLRMQISKMYANAAFAGEVGLSRPKKRCSGLNRVQQVAINPVTLPSADSLAWSLLKKSAAISGIFGSEG
jgi:hypothetical protein